MTTMMLDNPLVDFSRADFSSFAVPSPVRAAVTDSYIEENRRGTPQSAINQRRTERLTVSELNDMDMDEIVKRAYMVPIDTRGPVTRFLDLIDLPRNALFNLAAGDTARRKQGMGDTAALGLPRVNTSDVLESLGVRPGLVTGIAGFVGDVALDPLTYIGPAGWGVRLTGAGGKAVSMTGKGGKILKNTVKEIETGARISDDTVRRYLESTGLTDDVIAKGDRKVIAKEVSDILGQGERTTFNKFMRIFGEAKEFGEIPGKNTLADDITSFIAPDADDLTKARITAAQDFYKAHGRPFTPGIRVVKDPASKLGYSFTTSKNVPKGSGVFHVPFTQYDFSIPGFTPAAIQQTQLANLVNDAVATGEYFSSEGMVRVTDLSEQLKESLNRYKARVETADQPPKRSITEIAGTTTPMSEPAGVDVAQTLSPMEVRAEAIKDLRRETKEILTVMSDTIKRIEADPAAKYADLLYARSQFEVMSNQAKVADADAAMLFKQLEEGKKYRTSIDTDVAKRVTDSMNNLSAERAEREALVGERKRRFEETARAIETESVEANVESAMYNPATPIEKDENIVGNLPRGLTKAQVFNSEKMLSGHADPALDLDLYNSNAELNQSWNNYRSSDPTTPKGEEALGKLLFKDEPVYDEARVAELPDLSQLEFVTDDQQRLYDEALKAAQTGTRRVEMQPGQGIDFVADKDSQALSNLQESLWVEGKVKTQVDRIDVNKLQVGDTFKFGKANASQANPLTIEVIKIDDEGRVYVKAKMPQPREKARKWHERAKKTEPVKAVPDRYYILKPDAVNIYASRGVDGNPTVLRKVVTEAPQKLTNNIDELASNNEFVQRVDDIGRGHKVRNTIESKFAEGEFSRTKEKLSKASGLENKRQAIKDINEEQAGELLKSLGTTPEDNAARHAIYDKFPNARQQILFHGSPSEFDELDLSKSGGGVSLTSNPTTAKNYAAGAGGARKQSGKIVAISEDGIVYHKVGNEWVAYGTDYESTGKIEPLTKKVPPLSQEKAEDLQRQGLLWAGAADSYVYSVDIGNARILDLTTPEGKAVFAGLPKTGSARSDEIIKYGFNWQDTRISSFTGAMEPIYAELRKLGYDGIRHGDDGPTPTVNIFNKDKLRIVGREKLFQTPPAPVPNYDRMSAAELKAAAKQAGVDTRTGRAEMIRDLKQKAASQAATPSGTGVPQPAAAAPTPKPAATPTPITVGPEKVKSSLPPMTAEKRDDLIRQLNQRMVNRVEAISKLIYGMTREQVPSIDLDQIIDVVSEIVFSQADPSKITPEYVIRNVRLKLFDEATPSQFRYESFGREIPTKQRASELAMSRLGLTADDFRRPQFGEGTVYEGMSPDEIRETIAAQERNEMLKTIRFKKHPEVEGNFNEEMSNLRVDQINRFVQVDEANKEIERRIRETTAKITRDGKKAAKDRMNEADNAWREVQRRKFAEGRSVAETDAYFDKLKSDIYNKADDDIATIEQQTKIALQNVEQDVSQTVLKERGLTEADMDTRLGKGTEYEGLTEQQIEAKMLRKHEDAYEAKYAEEIAQDKNKAVPKYYSEEELADMEAEVMHLHAMADAAARVANSSTKPLLSAAGSKVTAAVNAAREALGLGADDLGSGILASMATMTEPWAAKGQYGQAAYEMMRGLERTFVTRMGLAPGIANDMVKQFVRAQDISQTQSFRMTIADIQNTLLKSGIPKENWEQASRLAMALMFVGNTPIEQMKALASRDVAFREVLEAIQGGLLDPAVNPNGAAAIQALADKYRKILDNLDTGSGIKNYVPNVLTPQAQNFINFQRNNQALLLSGTPSTGGVGAGDIGVPAEQFLERFQKPRSTLEHRYIDPVTKKETTFLESEVAYLDYSEDYLNALENESSLESLSGTVSGKDMAAYIRTKQDNVKKWMNLSEVERQTAETYYLSPHEINRRVKEDDMFDNLTNRALNGNDFMYADVLRAVAQRLGSEERKIARDTLQKYLAPYELLIDQIPLNVSGTAGGKKPPEFLTTNGTKVQIVNEGGDNVIYVGNIKYRRPKAILSPEFSLGSLFRVGDKPITALYYPEQIADIIDDAAGFFGKPRGGSGAARAFGEQSSVEDNFARLLKGADKITGYWKITTLLHPSWTVNDVVGNLFLMANMGISPEKAARNAMQTLKFILAVGRGDTEALSKMKIAGRNGVEHLTGPLSQVIDTAGNVEVSRQLRTTGEFVDPYTFSVLQSIKKLAKGDINGAKQEFVGAVQESIEASKDVVADRIATKPGVTTAGAKARVGADFAFNQMLVRRVWQPWAHLNGISNNWLKATAYFSLLDEGYEATQAARLVSEKMLDMSVLTSTDRAARRLFPFYNWMKNSGVLGVREFLRNPKYFTIAPKIKQALEESFNGEENLPENARPSWIRDQLAFQIGTDPDTRRALTLTSSLPTEAATYAISFLASPFLGAGALQDSLAYVTNALTPVIKVPAELGARKEFFTKRTISSEGGDITPTEYAIGQVRPLRELGIGSLRGGPLIRAFQDDPVLGISRGLIGGRLQPFDEERRVQNLQREYDERVDSLRRRIGIAERENQKEESIRRRIDLLKVFNQMEGLGLSIPKWAGRQVEQIKATQGAT